MSKVCKTSSHTVQTMQNDRTKQNVNHIVKTMQNINNQVQNMSKLSTTVQNEIQSDKV